MFLPHGLMIVLIIVAFGVGVQLHLEDGRRFTYSELVKITKNFASPIGAGGFGKVYHGILENDIQVAVKLLNTADQAPVNSKMR